METSLEVAVRAYLQARYESLVGRRPELTPELKARIVDQHIEELLPILRRRFSDDEVPTKEDFQKAEMTASLNSIKRMVGMMSSPKTAARLASNPKKLAIVAALAKNAAIDLVALRTLRNNPTEKKLEKVTQEIKERMERLTEKIKTIE